MIQLGLDLDDSNSSSSGQSSDDESLSPTIPINSKLPKRKSAIAAEDTIRREEQEKENSVQETYIDVPYHKPKSHSLAEFLNRKSLSKSSLKPKENGRRRTIQKIKMTPEELLNYA